MSAEAETSSPRASFSSSSPTPAAVMWFCTPRAAASESNIFRLKSRPAIPRSVRKRPIASAPTRSNSMLVAVLSDRIVISTQRSRSVTCSPSCR